VIHLSNLIKNIFIGVLRSKIVV